MATLPKVTFNPLFTYRGSYTDFPEDASIGDLVVQDNTVYGYMGETTGWVLISNLSSPNKKTLIKDLKEFLNDYSDSPLKSEILNIIELYRMCAYE